MAGGNGMIIINHWWYWAIFLTTWALAITVPSIMARRARARRDAEEREAIEKAGDLYGRD